MAELCRDIHIGRKSSNYDKLEQRRQLEKLRRRNAVEETPEDRDKRLKLEEEAERERRKMVNNILEKGVPRLHVVGGKIVVDEDSLQVDRHERDARPEVAEADKEVEDEFARRVNSGTWSKREKVERWDMAETQKFYEALSMWGTDFNLIAQMFRGRSRRQIKSKFNAEERKNPEKVHMALTRRMPVNLESYEVVTGKTFKEISDVELAISSTN
ncbi:uncharacterized protein V1510DRAFT_414463 [Dipodascopsis tothii]|uniref:uncharacterized protein n=1 Tax=Dipodascopsis tothii TaxID=44089 RepID=UPI0034CD5729